MLKKTDPLITSRRRVLWVAVASLIICLLGWAIAPAFPAEAYATFPSWVMTEIAGMLAIGLPTFSGLLVAIWIFIGLVSTEKQESHGRNGD
jgi:uncharacterized RDD family membrane protein YckC